MWCLIHYRYNQAPQGHCGERCIFLPLFPMIVTVLVNEESQHLFPLAKPILVRYESLTTDSDRQTVIF